MDSTVGCRVNINSGLCPPSPPGQWLLSFYLLQFLCIGDNLGHPDSLASGQLAPGFIPSARKAISNIIFNLFFSNFVLFLYNTPCSMRLSVLKIYIKVDTWIALTQKPRWLQTGVLWACSCCPPPPWTGCPGTRPEQQM